MVGEYKTIKKKKKKKK